MEKDILTIEEAAALLKLSKTSVKKLAKKGKIPAKKIMNKWRFEKSALINWVAEDEK